MSIINLIASNNFITVNRDLIKLYGLEEAVILGELASEYSYWERKGELDDDGYFFSTIENIEETTGIKVKQQRKALETLKECGIIDAKLKGLPARRYIKIFPEGLEKIFGRTEKGENKIGQNGQTANAKLDNAACASINNIENNNKLTIHYSREIHEIVDYLNEKLNCRMRYDTKLTVKCITARLNEGFTVDDFKTVIDNKYNDWYGTEYARFLSKPDTLFGSKFESYLNEQYISKPKPIKKQETEKDPKDLTTEELERIIERYNTDPSYEVPYEIQLELSMRGLFKKLRR